MRLNKSIVLAAAFAVAAASAPILTATGASAATPQQLTNATTTPSLTGTIDHKTKGLQLAEKKKKTSKRK
ncbi:hypothetical protein EV217_5011 [Phyllobacterium myrsinacearum]|uniref:hypothetical protein n=1 Tax=Phyllobacterium myrsinacearum TaxID=28101 RepID=UPI001029A765|nr:hypothetical protein [Phyllobacterium myrsinacearum]RZS76788.1 hypothetical protein EV217_5011 [Phyllobacterium myrsinacearum]